ncbi:uncharacterized protein LOC125576147 [Brassica napus]|uniref:uncharacterized protein LOC125576147 n=1 Tax=Brassica napus TaxID=3708 RepID=UPI0020788E02|nr:uncharacterized protein LOC125576147 [Brassica napus]
MKIKHQGTARVKRAQLQRLRKTFETLEMRFGEGVAGYFVRLMEFTNDMRNCGEGMDDVKIVEKLLRSLTENFNFLVCSIEESKEIDRITVDELKRHYKSMKVRSLREEVKNKSNKWKMNQGMVEEEEDGTIREEETTLEDEGEADPL